MDKIRLINDPVLRVKARKVEDSDFPITPIVDSMIRIMQKLQGVGLAANQIGDDRAIFVTDVDGVIRIWVNPKIVEASDEIDFEEGCLSIPGTCANTRRFSKATIEYTNTVGVRHKETLDGLLAVVVQHEIDHLNGKLYIDQLSPPKRSMVLGKHSKYLKFRGEQG